MPTQNWKLFQEEPATNTTLYKKRNRSATTQRLRGGLSDGVDVVTLQQGDLSVAIVPTRGMGIHHAQYKDVRIGWQSPVRGPVHPAFVNLAEPSGIGWLDGFDELLVRCGLESNGAPEFDNSGRLKYPLHGRIANRPARNVTLLIDDETGTISLSGEVDEARLMCSKLRLTSTLSIEPAGEGFSIVDRVENIGGTASDFQMLYHINLGLPFLTPGTQLFAPLKIVAPRTPTAAARIIDWSTVAEPQVGREECVYYCELMPDADHMGHVLLQASESRGVSLHYDTRELPCFSFWKYEASSAEGYVVGIEPGTNFPNPRSFETEQGRTVKLEPGESRELRLSLRYHDSRESVAGVRKSIRLLQGTTQPVVDTTPRRGWSPGV